jgi:hypothetical protein
MRCDQSGPIIQVKEEIKFPFYSPECCKLDESIDHAWPIRCADHNKEFMKWKRIKKTRIKFKSKFNKNRHKFIKMLTFGLPGEKTTTNQISGKEKIKSSVSYIRNESPGYSVSRIQNYSYENTYQVNDDHKLWRNELRKRFNKLRKDPWWKKHVDGGIWFYETVLTELDNKIQMSLTGEEHEMNDIRMKIHPHFHCMILGPKNLAGQERNFQELNELFEKHGLGKPSVSVAKSKDGRAINASLNKSLWYLTNYLKKQDHAEGINRGSFGIFNKKSK